VHAPQADQDVAAVRGRPQDRVEAGRERVAGVAEILGRQRGAVGADQDRRRRAGERALKGAVHARPEIAGPLLGERRAVRRGAGGEERVRRGIAAELDGAEARGRGGRERAVDEPLVQPRGARGAEHRDEARLHLAGPRRLGEDDERRAQRGAS
jgi:hypothetical protein